MIVDAAEFSLWLSPHILGNVECVLTQLLKWEQAPADAYLRTLLSAAEHSGGGVVADVPRTVHDCPDYEDNLILDLAGEVCALIVVCNDTDLLSMSPWRGSPIIEPRASRPKSTPCDAIADARIAKAWVPVVDNRVISPRRRSWRAI